MNFCPQKYHKVHSLELVPTPEEVAERETQRAGEEAQRADRLAAKLRELNIDPDTI